MKTYNFKRKGTVKNVVTWLVIGALSVSVISGVASGAKSSKVKKDFTNVNNQISLESDDVKNKIADIKTYELEQHTTLGTLTKKDGTVFKRLKKLNESSVFSDSSYVSDTLQNGGTMTKNQYEQFKFDQESLSRNIDRLSSNANYDTSGLSEKIANVTDKNSKNNKEISNQVGDMSLDLSESNKKLESDLSKVTESSLTNMSQSIDSTNKSIKSAESGLTSDLEDGVSTFVSGTSTDVSELYRVLNLALSEDNDDAYAAILEWYYSSNTHLQLLISEVNHAKKQVSSNLQMRNQIIGNADGGYVTACLNAGHLTFGDLASALTQANLTSYTIPTSDSNLEFKRHYHTFGTDSNGDPIYKEDVASYCDEHNIPYSFGSDMTFYCEAKSPSEIVEAMGGDPSSSCYASAGHTHSSDAAGHSDNNVKYTGHHCTWEHYQYESKCGASLKDKGSSKVVDGYNTNGEPIYRTQYHGTCPNGHGDTRSWSAMPSTCGYTVTKTGERYTCGSPVNTYKPTKCGYENGEPVQARYTVGDPDADLGSGDIEEITH